MLRLVDRWSAHVADRAVLLIRRFCLLGRYHWVYWLAWALFLRMGSLSVLVLLRVTLPRLARVPGRLVTSDRDGRSYFHLYRISYRREMLLDLQALDLRRGNRVAAVLLNHFLLHGEWNGLWRRRHFGDDRPIQRAIRRFRHVHRRCSGADDALCLWRHDNTICGHVCDSELLRIDWNGRVANRLGSGKRALRHRCNRPQR